MRHFIEMAVQFALAKCCFWVGAVVLVVGNAEADVVKAAERKAFHAYLAHGKSAEADVLKTLTVDTMHGYAIAQHIERLSNDVLRVQEGTLYPALQMMEVKGWVKSEWKLTPTKRRARYYAITTAGKKQLAQESRDYERVIEAVGRVMQTT